jgi:arylsulfatase A-like enzyme
VRSEVRFIVLSAESVLAEKAAFKHALIDGRHKLIKDFREQTYELYDLERDPGERENLASLRPELLQEMIAALDRTQSADTTPPADGENAALDPNDAEMLRKLGYIDE